MIKSDPSTWADQRHRDGEAAERRAADLLIADGYAIIEQRYRFHHHDVDLIARRGNVVVFVEVRSRRSARFGKAIETVRSGKQRDLVRAASSWLQRHGRPGDVARFDVVAIQAGRMEWVQSAFRPLWR
ncbi:MAG TPA: YraN family protein [Gemmatimonadales bacterium]